MPRFLPLCVTLVLLVASAGRLSAGDDSPEGMDAWLERFVFEPPAARRDGICRGTIGALPSFVVTASRAGRQLVRISVPFPPGAVPEGVGLRARTRTGNARLAPLVTPEMIG